MTITIGRTHGLCLDCKLRGDSFPTPAEAAALAAIHDGLHHRGNPTMIIVPDGTCEGCRDQPAVATWNRPESGPLDLCQTCRNAVH